MLPVNVPVLYRLFFFFFCHLQNESRYINIIGLWKLHVSCKLLQMPLLYDLCWNERCPFCLTSVVQGMCKYLSCNCSFLKFFLLIFLYQLNHLFWPTKVDIRLKIVTNVKYCASNVKKEKKKKKKASLWTYVGKLCNIHNVYIIITNKMLTSFPTYIWH